MTLTELQDWVVKSPAFLDSYRTIRNVHVMSQFNLNNRFVQDTTEPTYNRLLTAASVLAQESEGRTQGIALRIAQACLEHPNLDIEHKVASVVILNTMLNIPATALATTKGITPENIEELLPNHLLGEKILREFTSSTHLYNNDLVLLNSMQKQIHNTFLDNSSISISAPTSAGKSFSLKTLLLQELLNLNFKLKGIYIVPTRALITQVTEDFEDFFTKQNIDCQIITLPWVSTVDKERSYLYVVTQERALISMERDLELNFGIAVIDEAHKVGDGKRGILLEHAIAQVMHRNASTRVVFASPLTENPAVLFDGLNLENEKRVIKREEVTVNQNLLWASQVPRKPGQWCLDLIDSDNSYRLGDFTLPYRPDPPSKRLPFVAYALGSSNVANLVYVPKPGAAETCALNLYELIGNNVDDILEPEIVDLIQLSKETVHPEYCLANLLERRVAVHYGNMPQLIRSEIENLFKTGKLRFMVCTSTLVEGVNLPCKSIFIASAKKGNNTMSESDFWNLAGRAGRWGKEFQGNVICVDPGISANWPNRKAPRERAIYPITPSLNEILSNGRELIDLINERDNVAPNVESDEGYGFSHLVAQHIGYSGLSKSPIAMRIGEDQLPEIEEALDGFLDNSVVSRDVILANPGVNPQGLEKLMNYFRERTQETGYDPEEYLIVPASSEDSFENYNRVLNRINSCFGFPFGAPQRARMLALLLRDWMSGYQLRRMIENRIRYLKEKEQNFIVATVIRDCMRDIEENARFLGPKYFKAYNAVFAQYLRAIDRNDLLESIEDMEFQLELGVSQRTQLSLMSIGLSRSTAISLSELIIDTELNVADCLSWLEENDWMTDRIPKLSQREIRQKLERLIGREADE